MIICFYFLLQQVIEVFIKPLSYTPILALIADHYQLDRCIKYENKFFNSGALKQPDWQLITASQMLNCFMTL